MAEINGEEKRIGVSGEQIEEVVGKMPAVEADVKENKQNISALQTASAQHTADIARNTADIELKANADEVYSKDETDSAITAKVAEIVAGAPEEFDTLKEMSDWLTEHSGSAAEMNTAIQTNTKAIADNAKAIEENTANIEGNTADIEQNKSDISLLNENKMPLSIGAASSNLNEQKWYKLATFRTTVSNNTFNSAFYIQDRKNGETGILHICVERHLSNGVPSATASRIGAHWISAEYQSYSIYKKRNNFVIVGYIENDYLVCELWCRVYDRYGVYYALQLTNTRQTENKMGTNEGWILEKTTTAYDKPYDTYPELTSPTVRVVYTKDRLAEALEKIDNFETRITALETALSQTTTVSE